MHISITGLLAVILSITGYMLTVKYLSSKPRKNIIQVMIASSALALPGMFLTIYYFHLIPEMKWYYDFRSLPGVELLTMFIGIAGGAYAVMLSRRYQYWVLIAVVLLSSAPYIKPLVFPLKKDKLRETWKGGICIQSSGSTCGPSSAATIMSMLGMPVSELELAQASYTSASGTEAWFQARALRSRGAEVKFIIMPPETVPEYFPCIAGVKLSGGIGHFIAILKRNGAKYEIGDPMSGPESLSTDELIKRYKFTGFAMHITIAK